MILSYLFEFIIQNTFYDSLPELFQLLSFKHCTSIMIKDLNHLMYADANDKVIERVLPGINHYLVNEAKVNYSPKQNIVDSTPSYNSHI